MGCAPSAVGDGEATPANYLRTSTGIREQSYDFRTSLPDKPSGMSRPTLAPGKLFTDITFELNDAVKKKPRRELEWDRPLKFLSEPKLFGDVTSRYHVVQGGFDSGSFVAALAGVTDHQSLLKQVIPSDAYPTEPGEYRGMFHARYWRFGQWEDIYIDDRLPIDEEETTLFGAVDDGDPKALWVSLLEKAFARHYGGYNELERRADGEYYVALTGGVAERINVKKRKGNRKAKQLFHRIQNAVDKGYHITCYVPEKCDGENGISGDHTYYITGTAELLGHSLIRLVNPWGSTEWEGDWCECITMPRFQGLQLAKVAPSKRPSADIEHGEFWMSLGDFSKFVSEATICGLTPDYDHDDTGSSTLRFVTNVYGEWKGETAAGSFNRLQNPRFTFTVPDSNQERPVVLQMIQNRETPTAEDIKVRCDLYKVISNSNNTWVLEILRNKKDSYRKEMQCVFRHKVSPGDYVIIPSTEESCEEKSFLIRVFSSRPLSPVTELPQTHTLKLAAE